MALYSIEGKFLTQTLTGTQRYAIEIVHELDRVCEPGEFEIVVPDGTEIKNDLLLDHIPLVRFGCHTGPQWTHIDFSHYCKKVNSTPLCLNNIAPIHTPSVVTIHDVSPRANREFYGWKYRAYQNFCLAFNTRNAKLIFTDTDFSRSEIERYYPCAAGKTKVVPCAWQHMEDIKITAGALAKHGLEPGGYWFAMSSLTPNKNLRWIVETARLNLSDTFIVAGGINTKTFGERDIPTAENVSYIGYVTDGEAKELMSNCKGFLFPTFYEGFGIPPMEAMASGAPLCIVGDNPCMHEVYGNSVVFVDPNVPCADLAGLAQVSLAPVDDVLARFSWRSSAEKMIEALRELQ